MVKFQDIFQIDDTELKKYKAHFAIGDKKRGKDIREPLFRFYNNKFKSWQELQRNENFQRPFIISFVYFSKNEWLFVGVYKTEGVEKKGDLFLYKTKLMNIKKELIGRLVINFKKTRASYRLLENCHDQLVVSEILKNRSTIERFPGYENVIVDFNKLTAIIKNNLVSWETALASMKGIYLITDIKVGKHYVGSAYGDYAFWDRWSNYVKTGHGGNRELKTILEKNGLEYASNFQFSILEVRKKTTDDYEIINREKYWKDVLKSREFGYNSN